MQQHVINAAQKADDSGGHEHGCVRSKSPVQWQQAKVKRGDECGRALWSGDAKGLERTGEQAE